MEIIMQKIKKVGNSTQSHWSINETTEIKQKINNNGNQSTVTTNSLKPNN
jgi:hypothetical protein